MATWPNIIDDDGTGTSGTPLSDALFDQIKAYIDAGVPGGWQDVPFNAGNYMGSGGMTWTLAAGHQLLNRWKMIGAYTMLWTVYIAGGPTGGTPATKLYVAIPGGYAAANNSGAAATAQLYDGIHQPGFVAMDGTGGLLRVQKASEGNFSIGPIYLRFTTILETL